MSVGMSATMASTFPANSRGKEERMSNSLKQAIAQARVSLHKQAMARQAQKRARDAEEDAVFKAYQSAIMGVDCSKQFNAWQKKVAESKKAGEQIARWVEKKAKAKSQAEAKEAKAEEEAWFKEREAEYKAIAKKAKVIPLPSDGKPKPIKLEVIKGVVIKYDFFPRADIPTFGCGATMTKAQTKTFHAIQEYKAWQVKQMVNEAKRGKSAGEKLIFSKEGKVINGAQLSFTFTPRVKMPEVEVVIPETVEIPEVPEVFPVVIPNYPVAIVQATA